MKGSDMTDEERAFARDCWLHYFNRFLYENGTIDEGKYKRMLQRIAPSETSAKRSETKATARPYARSANTKM